MTSMWRVSRVDKGAVRLVPDGAASVPADGTVVVGTERDGTLPMTAGEPVVPAVGDRVVLDGERALVMPRTSELVRDTVGKTSLVQVIAANVDVVLIVEHLEPEPALGRIERMLTIAWRSDAVPVVVLTKVDLVDDADRWLEATRAVAPGVDVLAISAATGAGLEALTATLQQARTLVLVGPSGAGKSTLVNALAGAEVMVTGEVRGDGRGMHTTTHRELIPLPDGRWLIDTPGVRSIGLVATEEAVAATFSDVEERARGCRFRDCTHTNEPECAVVEAVEAGELPERRLASWHSLRREATRQAARAVRAPKAAGHIRTRR
ncbi:ribosome small subunit-dependent GTPase A [Pseudactinotalea sp.]|uniref:ribosome small subunit-dependent GTPase A n=1 Tax=Pseudactinotalea sp. TaxID=1926260 RepID=UPI003B3AF56F